MPRVGRLAAVFACSCAWMSTASAQVPELSASQVVADLTAVSGERLNVSADVQASSVTSFTWRAVLTLEGAIATGIDLGTHGPVTVTNGAATLSQALDIPSQVSGRYRLAIVLDPSDTIVEGNEYDNVALAADFTRIRSRKPDIRVASVNLGAASRRAGEALDITYTLVNAGEVNATFDVAAHVSSNGAVTTSDPEIGRETVTVNAGASVTRTLSTQLPGALVSGDYSVAVIADPELQLEEVIEFDNIAVLDDALNVFADTLSLDTTTLPAGTVFIGYEARLAASGGDGHYNFSVTQGALPEGIELNSAGLISGVPLESGAFSAEVTVSSAGMQASQTLGVTVRVSGIDLTITTPSLGSGAVSLPYQASLAAAGGEPPYTWNVSGGTLPPGVDLTTAGWMSGLPSEQGSFTFNIEVEDGLGNQDEREYTMIIDAASIVISTSRLPPSPVGAPLDFELMISGGKPPYTWEAKSTLPPGLSLTEDGHITGTPTRVGVYRLRVLATDSSHVGGTDTALIHFEIEETGTFEITVPARLDVLIREPVRLELTADGGTPPYTWRLAPGDTLPQGFVLLEENGVYTVEGGSILPVAHAFSVEVDDAEGRRREAVLSINVERRIFGAQSSGCAASEPVRTKTPLLTLLFGLLLLGLRKRR